MPSKPMQGSKPPVVLGSRGVPESRALSTVNPFQLDDEVQHHRQKAALQDREKQKKKGKGVSAFGLNTGSQLYESVKRHSELYVVQAGQNAVRQPLGLELRAFNPREPVSTWATWIRRQCQAFHSWTERKDCTLVIEDLERSAWVGLLVKGSTSPLRVTLPEGDGVTVQVLLSEISEKQKIIFVLPITVLDKPRRLEDSSDSEYLADDPVKLMTRKTRSTVIIHGKRGQEESNSSGRERVKRQRSGLLEERAGDDRTERSWQSEMPALSEKSDEVIEEEENATIKVEVPHSESPKPLTQEELVEKAKAQREVQEVVARETGLRRSARNQV